MEISICSWTFGNTPTEEIFKRVSEAGYTHIDLTAVEQDWMHVNKLCEKYSLIVSGLTCNSGWPNEDYDLANKNKDNRNSAIRHFKEQIESVRKVNGNYLIVVPSAVGRFFSMGDSLDDDWKWAVDSIQKLTDTAKRNGVTIVIEPLNRYESSIVNTADDVLRFMNDVNDDSVKALLDTYHMNIEETDFEEAILKLNHKLEVVHFADSNRQGIGRGHINFEKIVSALKKINFDKTIVLECTAPGSNPFIANKGEDTSEIMTIYAKESLEKLNLWFFN